MPPPQTAHHQHVVLVVDDDVAIVTLLKKTLEQDGFQVYGATGAAQALECVASNTPCMVLMDVMMPGMDGFELCRKLKQDPRTLHVPVALITAMTRAEDVQRGIDAGAADYIKKPFDHAELRMRVRNQILLHETLLEQQGLHKHLSAISAASHDAIVIINSAGRISHWNEAAEKIFGYARTEAMGQVLHELLVPKRYKLDYERAFPNFRATGEGAAIGKTRKLPAVRKSGEEFPCELSLSAADIDGEWCAVGIVRDISDQMQMQAALRKTEDEYRQLFEGSVDALTTISGPNWHFSSCNQSFVRLVGAESVNEVTKLTPMDLSPELQPDGSKSSERFAQVVAQALDNGSASLNWLHCRLDGTTFLSDILLTRVGEGANAFILGSVRDVTERAREAAAVRESELLYRTGFEGASVGQALTDVSGRFLDVNAALARMLGRGVKELLGQPFAAFTHPDDVEMSVAAQRALLADQHVLRMEKRYLASNGDVLWTDVNVAALRDSNGEVSRFVTHVIDITERKRAEQAAAASNEFLGTLLDAIPVPVFYKDADGRYRGVNQALKDFFGTGESQIIGKTAFELYKHEQAEFNHRKDLELFATQGSQVYQTRLTDARGASRDVIFHKAIFADRNQVPLGLIGVIMDVTDHKRVENELQHARKLEAVGQLAAGIAHEINTPAQYVGDGIHFLREVFEAYQPLTKLYREVIELLQKGEAVDERMERLRELEENADIEYVDANVPGSFERCAEGMSRISAIVRAMKEFSHPDQREKSPADLNQALRSTLTIARNEYKYVADAEIDFGDLPPVPCHVSDLNQVFLNLIVNSAHAIEDVVGRSGMKGKIRIRTRAEAESVKIDISDTGCGIPESMRERIFEPFFTTKEVGKGTGQGLAIARSIVVDKHEGSLTFVSEIGVGTTFTVRLPLHAAEPVSRRSLI